MAKTYEELLAGATQIKNNELPESNTHSLVGGQLVDMVEKQKEDSERIDNVSKSHKGYFQTLEQLKAKYPTPKEGETAWVGEPYPGNVFDVVDGAWHDTSVPANEGGGSGSSNYNDLENKPSIGNVSLEGNKTLDELGIASKQEVEGKQDAINTVNLSVGNGSGTPSGSASVSGNILNINLENVKGGKGNVGEPGPANTITIGNVVASDETQEANATMRGESPNQILDLVLPRGKKGDSGVQLGDVVLTQELDTSAGSEDKVVSQKTVSENLILGGEESELSSDSSVSAKTVNANTGEYQESSSQNSVIFEYSIDDHNSEYYASGRIGITEGTCMIAYYKDETFISSEIVSNGIGKTISNYKMTVPSDANICRIAGNTDYQVPVLISVLKEFVNERAAKTNVKEAFSDLTIEDNKGNVIVEFSNGHIKTKEFDSRNAGFTKYINILSIGNSYSRDCLSHVPYILKNVSPNIKLTIGLLYYGGCSLEQHYDFMANNQSVYEFCQYDYSTDKWTNIVSSKTIEYALAQKEWNIILFQQKSSDSINYNTCQPYLNNIIAWLVNKLNYNFRAGWIETHAYASGYSGLSSLGISSDDMALKSAETSKSVIENTVLDFILPYGIAIQNARHTNLDNYGNHMTYEGTHLNEGIATLLAGYTIAQKFANMFSAAKSILGDPLRPTKEWQTEKNIPQPHGDVLGISNDNCLMAQKCAFMAIKNPYIITEI